MASQSKRPQVDSEGPSSKQTGNNGGDGVNTEVVVPDDFTDDLLDIVCQHLPVQSALRMSLVSLVSPRFRDLWKNSRNMVFDKNPIGGINRIQVIKVVHLAMNWHQGETIDKFSICIEPSGLGVLIGDWLAIATEKNVAEVEFDYSPSQVPCPLDFDLSGASTLTTLKLVNVKLGMPRWRHRQDWAGMANLRDLRLKSCDLKFFGYVFPLFPGLRCLELVDCWNVGLLCLFPASYMNFRTLKIRGCLDLEEVYIQAPTLQSFYYHGYIRPIVPHDPMPQLKKVFISYISPKWIIPENLCRELLIDSAASFKVLTVNYVFIEVICDALRRGEYGAAQILFSNVTELQIFMETYTYKTIGDVVCLLKRFPRLETLHIDLGLCCQEEAIEGLTRSPQPLHHLKTLKIKGFKSNQPDRDLLEYLVSKTTALQTLTLVTSESSNFRCPSLQLQYLPLLRIISLSLNLKVSIYNSNEDQSCIFPTHFKAWYLA